MVKPKHSAHNIALLLYCRFKVGVLLNLNAQQQCSDVGCNLLKLKSMRKSLFIFYPLLFGSIGVMLVRSNNKASIYSQEYRAKVSNSIGCGPGIDENIYADESGKFITVLPGWGNHSYRITTQNDSAQIYFNQGLSMYYSYHSREAIASFKEAARFDSSCAMVYWGQALAMGPYLQFWLYL